MIEFVLFTMFGKLVSSELLNLYYLQCLVN